MAMVEWGDWNQDAGSQKFLRGTANREQILSGEGCSWFATTLKKSSERLVALRSVPSLGKVNQAVRKG